MKFTVSSGQRLLLFVCVSALCFVICSVLVGIIMFSEITTARMRISTILQDLIVFVVPALIVAIMVTRRPAEFLQISKKPGAVNVLIVVCSLIAFVPIMNAIVAWNEDITLPENWAGIESWMRGCEESAKAMVNMLIGGTSIGSLVIAIFILGIAAGFSEELFFRGALQRILVTAPMNPHVAIWITAIIFSAIHMQFFGFVPRMLLGAYFGYLVWWSGSLWLGVAGHVANNVFAAISMWMMQRGVVSVDLNKVGAGTGADSVLYIIFSAAISSFLIYIIARRCRAGDATAK